MVEQKIKVLVADDDIVIYQKLIKHIIEKISDRFEITLASDGQEALDELKKQNFGVIVSDYQMPKIDGYELLTKTGENYPDIYCILVTSLDKEEEKVPELISDGVKYIRKGKDKSILIKELSAMIGDYLAQR